MSSADVGPLARNVIPTTATATLDLRLVKGNDYLRQTEKLRAHIRRQGFYVIDRDPTDEERRQHPLIAKVIHRQGGYNAQRTRLDSPFGRRVVEGGAICLRRAGGHNADAGRQPATFYHHGKS